MNTNQRLFFYMCVVLKLRGYSQEDFVFDAANVQIKPLNINTKESEFAPFKAGDRLFYTSSRERRIGVINLDESTGKQMLDIYYGDLKDTVTLINKKPVNNRVNTSLNQGTCFFDERTSRLYYAGNVPSIKKEKFKLAIFSTEFKGNKFLKPRIELLLPDTFLASHPVIYKNKMYFSSNLKGGKGQADIYTAELVDDKWTNIQNLDAVNSPYNDYFPFVINENEIYFSSDRPGGIGKLDLYKYSFSDGNARIRNLGPPLNSVADDFGLFMDPKQESGYFSTNRNNNQDDIYNFKKTWPSFNDCVAAVKESYCYEFTDEKSLDTDSLKGYFYEWDFGDGIKEKGISVTHCFLQPGNYVVNLNIIDRSTRAIFMNQNALDVYVDSIVQLKINALDTMLVNKKFTISTAGTFLPDKKITGYYFEVDDKRIRKESFEYNFERPGKHRIKLGIEYEDKLTQTSGLMCTTLDVTCVDSTLWLPYEKRKIDEAVAKFDGKNINAGSSRLEDMNYDAEIYFNQKMGLSKEKLADKVDEYVVSEANRQKISEINEERKTAYGKNIGNNLSGLDDKEEEAFLAFKKQLKDNPPTGQGTDGKNIGNNKYGLSDQEEEAFLAFKKQQQLAQQNGDGFNGKNLGNNLNGLSGEDEEAYLAFKFKQKQTQEKTDGFNGKNIGNNAHGLTDQEEEAFIAFKKQLKEDEQKGEALNGKNIGNNKYGLSDQEEEAFLVFKKKQQEQKAADGFTGKNINGNGSGLSDEDEEALMVFKYRQKQAEQKGENFAGKNIGNNKSDLSNMDEEASLAFKQKQKLLEEQQGKSFNGRNLRNNIDTLLNIDEDARITFRVHLGKSKIKKDTTYLNSLGLVGIKEEFHNNEYSYTYKNEKKVNGIEKYYQKALTAGIQEPVVIAYNNNVLIPNQAHHFKEAVFPEKKKIEVPAIVEKQGILARIFKKNKKADTLAAVQPQVVVQKKAVAAQPARDSVVVVNEPDNTVATAEKTVKMPDAVIPPKDKPEKEDVYFFPVALKPDDVKIEDLPAKDGVAPSKNYTEEIIEKYGEASAPGLEFRVQISAFKYRNRYEFPHLVNLGAIENTLTEGGITRITIGGVFSNYKKALEHNKKVIAAGQKDAFVTLFYHGKRVYLEDLEKMGIFLTK